MQVAYNPCWMFWKLPCEPGYISTDLSLNTSALILKPFRVKYKLSTQGKIWLFQRIPKEDYKAIISVISGKISPLKLVFDAFRLFFSLAFISSLGVTLIFLIKQMYVLAIICFIIAAISFLIVKFMGIGFIGILKKLRESFMKKREGLDSWLFPGDRSIVIGECCFWISFKINDSRILLHDHSDCFESLHPYNATGNSIHNI